MTGKEQAQNLLLKSLIFGDELDLGSADDFDEQPDPFARKMHDGAIRAALAKTNDAHCAIDLPMPDQSGIDDEISSPFLKAPRVVRYNPDSFRRSGGTKFVELLALLRKVFDGHEEEMHEAIETVTTARDDERNAMLAQIANAQ